MEKDLPAQRTTWILLAGLPATGKSALAHKLASQLERAAILDKDRVRESLFPAMMTDYSTEQDNLCMGAMIEAANYMTSHHLANFIFFDGRTFSRAEQIDEVLAEAKKSGAGWRILHLSCTDEVAEARLRSPDSDHPARNRDVSLYRRVKSAFEPILQPKLDLDTSTGVNRVITRALAYIRS
ncbi:MAG TPA: AAA family ATPase [Pseudacidobacterium sp.]|nr:AAA family ATPase [Pseudacidobacterium sp.]